MKGFQSVDDPVFAGFERIANAYPDKTAIIFLGKTYSYRELQESIYKFANALYGMGVRSNDKVAVYLPNCPQWIIAYLGTQKIGGIPVPIAPIYTPFEVQFMLNDAGVETIVCQDTNYGYVQEVVPRTKITRILITNLVDFLPWHTRMVGKMFNRVPHGAIHKGEGVFLFKDLLKKFPAHEPKIDINPREHLAFILYTGGTTGFPKGVQCTHAGTVSYILDLYDAIEGDTLEGEEILALVGPLFHLMGMGILFALGLSLGNTTILFPLLVVDALLDGIQKYRASLLLGVPALYRMILECDRLASYDLSSLKFCWSGGDLLPTEVFEQFKKIAQCSIRQAYGSTEAGHLCFGSKDGKATATSLGKPFSSRKVKIVDPETLKEVNPGQAGELIVSSPYILPYLNNEKETEKSFVEVDEKKWYKMGDFVRMDENGELHFVERTADIIKYSGYRVSASEIEAVLQNHSSVIGACVVGIPDPMVGERIKATVVLKEDARGVGAEDLIAFCKERLAPYKVPQYIDFRDMLPKSKVGKLLRREMREEERRKLEKEFSEKG